MTNDVKIDFGSGLPYLEQRFWEIIGKDAASADLAKWFKELQNVAINQTAVVQCVGMREPIPFQKIYQPTRLLLTGTGDNFAKAVAEGGTSDVLNRAAQSILAAKAQERQSISVKKFLERNEDAIIFAGPGWGKTTFLQHIFRLYVDSDVVVPVMSTLRRPTAIDDLERLVDLTGRIKKKAGRDKILLLVDGYDEISIDNRRRVSDAILRYQALGVGRFLLACREYYDVYEIRARELRIDHFNRQDKERFVGAFLKAFKSSLDAVAVVDDLDKRGFSEFLSHPLLLTLACILKTSSSTAQPRSALRLLSRALEVLCYRWDEYKGVGRQQVTPLDGDDRLEILKEIAFTFKTPYIQGDRALHIVRRQLDRMGFDRIKPREVLMETAQFYGILARRDEDWEFVHRTIHDFLGAQHWVETGGFANVTRYEWNARTAYAACLAGDSTEVLESALAAKEGLPTATEILSNAPRFDIKRITKAIIKYFEAPKRLDLYEELDDRITGMLESDFVHVSSTLFLSRLFEECAAARGRVTNVIAAYCLIELNERNQPLEFVSYEAGIAAYKSDRFTFIVPGLGHVRLRDLNPAVQRVPRLLRGRSKG